MLSLSAMAAFQTISAEPEICRRTPRAKGAGAGPLWITAAVLLALWGELIIQLRLDWSLNPAYTYGWSVPLLAVYLCWLRWTSRPAPHPAPSMVLPLLLVAAALAVLLPLRIVAKANPDWRLLSWTLAGMLALITFCVFFAAGGRPWLKHFAFPVLFFFVAVPWPTQIEQALVQQLMRTVAAIDVELLDILGIRALQHGNVIQLTTGLVGVEDACSGMRSLQSTLMVSIFLGELYFLRVWHRCALVLCGIVLAFFLNVGRTFVLAWVAAHRGVEAIASWHDPAGLAVLFTCLFSLWVISLWMKRRAPERPAPVTVSPAMLPLPALVALALWLCVVEAGSEAWFRLRQPGLQTAAQWAVQWNESGNTLEEVKIPELAAELLHYDEGRGVAWEDNAGRQWNLFFFKWLPGRTAALSVKIHRPEICLPASGFTPVGEPRSQLLEVNGVSLPTRAYRFQDGTLPLHIYYCYWDGTVFRDTQEMIAEDWTVRGRLNRVWSGRRDRGAQTLELAVWGHAEDKDADDALKRELARFVRG